MNVSKSFSVLLIVFVSGMALGERLCPGVLRDVFPVGGEAPIPQVESLNIERANELKFYAGESSPSAQLRAPLTFGFVAIRNEEVAGFVIAERRGRFVNLVKIAVSKGLERQGVGRDLVEKVVEQAKRLSGVEDVRVLVHLNDTDSRAFFSHTGFAETEIIPQKFERGTRSGVLCKIVLKAGDNFGLIPQLQRAPQPAPRPSVLVTVLPATREFLHRIDPTLENAD